MDKLACVSVSIIGFPDGCYDLTAVIMTSDGVAHSDIAKVNQHVEVLAEQMPWDKAYEMLTALTQELARQQLEDSDIEVDVPTLKL